MTTLQTFFGPPATTSIVGFDSTAQSDNITIPITAPTRSGGNLRQYLAGTTVANTYKTVLSVTGAGYLRVLLGHTINATSRNFAMRLTLDGVVVAEKSIVGANGVGRAFVMVGSIDANFSAGTTLPVAHSNIRFNKSMLIEMQSSLAETDFIAALVSYDLT